MQENDKIGEIEYSFMLGREKVGKKGKGLGVKWREHQDACAGELAKSEYEYG